MKHSFRGLVTSAFLIVACGSGFNDETTSGPPEPIPGVENEPSQGGTGGSSHTGSTGTEKVADGGGGGAPNDGDGVTTDGAPNDGDDAGASETRNDSGEGGAGGASGESQEPTTLQLGGCDPSAPFDAPVPAFTGSMNADGLTFSADGLTAYISGIGSGGYDIFKATRTSLTAPFGAASRLGSTPQGINTSEGERAPSLSPDGRTLYLMTVRGGWGDIAKSERPNTAAEFGPAQIFPTPINSGVFDQDPYWWGSQTLLFASERPSGTHRDLYYTTLTTSGFTLPEKIAGVDVNSPSEDFRPVLTGDGLTLFFASKRAGIGSDTGGDVWMANRTGINQPFAAAVNQLSMNSSGIEFPVYVTPDGCTLYFASNEDTGLADTDSFRLYQSTRPSNAPTQVTLTLNVVGQGSVTHAPFNCGAGTPGLCTVSGPPNTQWVIDASGQATWRGSCTSNGNQPSKDGVLVLAQGGLCTITFATASPSGPGGSCTTSMNCQQGLQCTNGTCQCLAGACSTQCPCGPGGSCTSTSQCQQGLGCTGGTCACVSGAACNATCPCGPGGSCQNQSQCESGLSCTSGICVTPGDCTNSVKDGNETDVDCGGSCGPCSSGKVCGTEADCGDGLECLDFGPQFEKPRGTKICVKPNCQTHAVELGCGFDGATCGRNCDGAIGCTTNGDCPVPEICGIGLGPSLGVATANVCVPPICVSDPVAGGCGQPGSLCGDCICRPSCENKQCGDDPSNGCDGRCRAFCDARDEGCTADADCPVGNACVFGGGPRIGLAAGTNVCLPSKCIDPNPARQPCGNTSSECGLCPEPPDDVCENRECGVDPSYGVSCGSDCNQGLSCVAGKCVENFSVSELDLPTISPDTGASRIIQASELRADPRLTVPGALDGSFDVDSHGRATYDVPIVVPPVRGGLEPEISLDFVNGGPNGVMGPGWSIRGLSTISRCPKIAAVNHGWVKPIEFTDDDQLCLDGKILVPVGGTHFQPGAEYRTEVDSFDRVLIQSDGTRISFRVQKKNGRVFYYGGSLNAELHRDRPNHLVRAWALARIEDRVGNFIAFSYGKFVDGGRADGDPAQTVESWLAEIAYGGLIKNGVRVAQPRRSLVFQYSNGRNDYMEGFTRGGSRIARTKLLTRIEAKLGDAVVRRYDLGYENAAGGAPITGLAGPKRLHDITECAHKTGLLQCKRPTVFDYSNEQGLRASTNGTAVAEVSTAGLNDHTDLVVLDWNGDGRDDILGIGNFLIRQNDVSHADGPLFVATDNPQARYGRVTATLASETCIGQDSVFDYNGDGRDDIFDTCDDVVYVSTGDTSNPFTLDTGGFSFGNGRRYIADLNGDGIQDVFNCAVDASYNLGRAGTGTVGEGFSEQRGIIPAWGDCFGGEGSPTKHPAAVLVVDIDADGADDVLMASTPRTDGWARYVPHSDGTAEWRPIDALPLNLELIVRSGQPSSRPSYRYGSAHFLDVNGDGLKDVYASLAQAQPFGRPDPFRFEPIVFTNLGGYFDEGHDAYWCDGVLPRNECLDGLQARTRATPYSLGGAIAADYTGDGRDDLMRMFSPDQGQSSSLWQLDVGAISDPSIQGALGALPVLLPDLAPVRNGQSNLVPGPSITPMVRSVSRQPDAGAPITTLADADGDGSQDVVMVASNGDLVVLPALFGREHLLARVTNGMGKRVTVEYQTSRGFSDGTHPVNTTGVFSGNHQCFDSDPFQGHSVCARPEDVGPLVSHYLVQKEEGGAFNVDRSFALRYEGARQGLVGRGFLGFTRRIIEERAPGAVFMQRTEIFEDNRGFDFDFDLYPRAGLELKRIVTTPVAGSTLATEATFGRVTRENDWGELPDYAEKLSSKERPFPALRKTMTTVEEVTAGGEPNRISRTRTVYSLPDAYGNITHLETTLENPSDQISTTTVDRMFDIRDGEEWLTGLMKRVEVKNDSLIDDELAVTRVVEYGYNELGLLESATREPDEDQNPTQAAGLRQVTTYDRDPADPFQVVRKVTTSGDWLDENEEPVSGTRVTSVEYDEETMFPLHVHSHNGAAACSFQNSHTAECQTFDVSYDPRDGTVVTRVGPSGIGERMQFDPFGRPLEYETAADTVTTRYTDALAPPSPFFAIFPKIEVETTSENSGARTRRRLDALGRVVQQETRGIEGATVDQEIEYLTGNLVSSTSRPHLRGDASQGYSSATYDARFRPLTRSFADSTFVQFQYAPAALIAGPVGAEPGDVLVTGIVDPNGRRSLGFSDARGVVSRNVDAKGNAIRYTYGPFLELASVIEPVAGQSDHVTVVETDKLGRQIEHRDADSGLTRYSHTAFDELAVYTDNRNHVTGLHYDPLGRLERRESDSDGTTYLAYDGPGANAVGRLVEAVSSDGHVDHYTYESPPAGDDPLENRGFLQAVERVIDGTAFPTTFHYNEKSQLSRVDYPPSPTSAAGDDESFAAHYAYDVAGNLTCVSDHAVPSSSECDAGRFWKLEQAFQGHRLQQESFGNGVTTTYGYDGLNGYLRSIDTRLGSISYQSITYPLYDNNGNLRRRVQTVAGPMGGETTTRDETFHYDELDRLTDVLLMNGPATIATLQHLDYADNGNISNKSDVGEYDYTQRSSDALRAPHAVRQIKRSGATVATYFYDGAGNMTTRMGEGVDGGAQYFSYTSFNLPRTITVGDNPIGSGGKKLSYGYDAALHRVLTTIESDGDPDPESRRFYVGDVYEREVTEDAGGPVTRHLYKVFAAGRQVSQVEREVRFGVSVESRRYIHADHQGSSQLVTNETGELVHVQRFDPFGKPSGPASGSTDTATRNIRAGYTGQETDVETGLVNMRGRIYDPRLARFLQADPIARFGSTQRLNRYSYVLNNPLNLTDPSGFEDEDDDDEEEDERVTDDHDGIIQTISDEGELMSWNPDCIGCDAGGPADATPTSDDASVPEAPPADDVAEAVASGNDQVISCDPTGEGSGAGDGPGGDEGEGGPNDNEGHDEEETENGQQEALACNGEYGVEGGQIGPPEAPKNQAPKSPAKAAAKAPPKTGDEELAEIGKNITNVAIMNDIDVLAAETLLGKIPNGFKLALKPAGVVSAGISGYQSFQAAQKGDLDGAVGNGISCGVGIAGLTIANPIVGIGALGYTIIDNTVGWDKTPETTTNAGAEGASSDTTGAGGSFGYSSNY